MIETPVVAPESEIRLGVVLLPVWLVLETLFQLTADWRPAAWAAPIVPAVGVVKLTLITAAPAVWQAAARPAVRAIVRIDGEIRMFMDKQVELQIADRKSLWQGDS